VIENIKMNNLTTHANTFLTMIHPAASILYFWY